jgi:hypothetical protein
LATGSTISNACSNTTFTTFYYTGSFIDGAQLWIDSSFTDNAPGANGNTVYYYSSDYNTIYYINDSNGHKYNTNQTCPTPTPVLTALMVNISLADASTACSAPEYLNINLSVYGSTIMDATYLLDLPTMIRADLSSNQHFWVWDKYGATFAVREFEWNNDATATPVSPYVECGQQ